MLQDSPEKAFVPDFLQHLLTLENLATAHLGKAWQVQALKAIAFDPEATVDPLARGRVHAECPDRNALQIRQR